MMRRWLPENVTAYKDRHGKVRYRFRKRGLPTYHFRFEPGTPEFMAEYHDAKSAVPEVQERASPYTYDALIASFYHSKKWMAMKPSSQKTYRGIIERFRAKNGTKDVRRVTAAAIDAKLASMAETPAAANNLRKTLARLHRHAIKLDWRRDNPVDATDAYKQGKGWHCWTEGEIQAFRDRWPLGTRERLALELLLNTALRESDVVIVGRQHLRDGELHLHHGKNESPTIVPLGSELAAAIAAYDSGNMTYLATQFGKPFTVKGFYNWFKRSCVKAGLPHCSPHGVRKAISRRLAESGATSLEGRAVTGHKTDREFARYAEQANRRALAKTAMGKVANHAGRTVGEPEKSR